jgi:hypothetical protein
MTADISVSTQTVYTIHNEGEWAKIGIKQGRGSSNWVHVTIDSSYGAMAHYWNNIGSQHWADFLHDPREKRYMMEKLSGYGKLDEFSFPKSMKYVRKYILEQRRELEITKDEARDAWDDLKWIEEGFSTDLFVDALGRIKVFEDQPWEWLRYEEKGWVQRFWDVLWVPFTTRLVSDLSLRNAA